jgi:hypothetical protein
MHVLFEAPTVAGMGSVLVREQIQDTNSEELLHLVAEVEELSQDNAQKSLTPENRST